MLDKVIKCIICKAPYNFMSMYAGDQSACPSCRQKANVNTGWSNESKKND